MSVTVIIITVVILIVGIIISSSRSIEKFYMRMESFRNKCEMDAFYESMNENKINFICNFILQK